MNKRIYIPIVAALLIIAAIAAVFVYAKLYRNTADNSPGVAAALPANPAVLGTFNSATPDSVTIILQRNGAQKTFSISSSTQVISQVQSGQVGKSLNQIATGTMVLVQPHAVNSSIADSVSVLPLPVAPKQVSASSPFYISGTILATTTASVTIKTATDLSLRIAFTKNAVFLSNVFAGQKGRSLSDAPVGTYVEVAGVAGSNGPTATSIQLLIPLAQ